jgi:hypothetical protein
MLSYCCGLSPKGSCVGSLVPSIMVWRGGGTFKRWSLSARAVVQAAKCLPSHHKGPELKPSTIKKKKKWWSLVGGHKTGPKCKDSSKRWQDKGWCNGTGKLRKAAEGLHKEVPNRTLWLLSYHVTFPSHLYSNVMPFITRSSPESSHAGTHPWTSRAVS